MKACENLDNRKVRAEMVALGRGNGLISEIGMAAIKGR
jgi:hypothetical protein